MVIGSGDPFSPYSSPVSTRKLPHQRLTGRGRIWRAFGLKPHLTEAFKLSTDPQFIDKVRDIVGLYLNPPEAALVLCVDEKTQVQALDRTAPVLPLLPGWRSDAPTTTAAMAPPISTPPWMWPRAW